MGVTRQVFAQQINRLGKTLVIAGVTPDWLNNLDKCMDNGSK